MSDRSSFRVASLLALGSLGMQALALVLMLPNSSASGGIQGLGFNGVAGVAASLTYAVVGWLLASRRRRNLVGWLFLVLALSQSGESLSEMYAYFGLITSPGSLPGADLASWIGAWAWVPGFVLVFLVLLVFPDGRLPSRRWIPVALAAGVGATASLVSSAVAAWGYRGSTLLLNGVPDHPDNPLIGLVVAASNAANLLIPVVGVACVAGLIVRFRRSRAAEREQIKWFVSAGAVEVGLLVLVSFVTLPFPFDEIAAIVVVPLVPIATAIAVLRYRLYEIDRIVSRSISWTTVTATLAGSFVAVVLVLQGLLEDVTQGQTLAVAASTLVAFALFQPIRGRVQSAVDRRFDRARYDAQRTVDSFAEELRSEVDLATLQTALVATAGDTVRPLTATLWLRPRADLLR